MERVYIKPMIVASLLLWLVALPVAWTYTNYDITIKVEAKDASHN